MKWFLVLVGFCLCYACIKFRETIANTIGEYDWMRYVGGSQTFVALMGILFFFWALAAATGTQEFFLSPILWIIPMQNQGGGAVPTDALY